MSETPKNADESMKKSLISFAFHGTPVITTEKLNGKNYLNWHSSVEIWFLGQRLSDHLTKKASEIDAKSKDDWVAADYQLVSVLWNSIEPKWCIFVRIGHVMRFGRRLRTFMPMIFRDYMNLSATCLPFR